MSQPDPSQLSDEELRTAVANAKPSPMFDAFFIGFLVGILIYSAAASAWGLVTVIPLVLIYALLKKPQRYAALRREVVKRGLN